MSDESEFGKVVDNSELRKQFSTKLDQEQVERDIRLRRESTARNLGYNVEETNAMERNEEEERQHKIATGDWT